MSAFGNPFTSGAKPNLSNTSGINPFTNNAASTNNMGGSAFGRPSFGTANTMTGGTTTSAFGMPQFGTNTGNTGNTSISAFGNTSNAAKPSAFGAPNLQSGAGAGSSPFGTTTSKANNNNNVGSSAFGTTNNQSPFSGGSGGTFGSASNLNKNTNGNFQSSFGNKGFSFGITPQNDANKVSQSNPSFGQTMPNTDPNISLKSNGNATSFGFGQQQMNATNVNANTATGKIRFVQGLSSEKDGILELADLAEETLKIFRANKFELGLVPDIPPPPALVA
ncbi:AVN_collapsed_G0010480.mRNA.1.CDS.1 [Saccharomyces cerevisiae]|nr:ANM_HP_G0198520.mRNA.1.CDS.1 [Saccharomyces cerevisiae]CAI5227236.1 ANM_HP_G0090930.mRNA.1.CDS.1 [Saccharomyces cerevisiae]CAI6564962.1 ANM_collapsed_G0010650.mRNA.1.CDS.1 [Saccharomyces cerevisiae]CAI6958261.1 ANM_HP_G0198520.mRNA.1.CDS.1 [Saccharomyces cerevisiae]CAI7032052.1 ANM_HP_G0090930.mRNA.1.CDS.1 [Saccharomyces cerevisiae]